MQNQSPSKVGEILTVTRDSKLAFGHRLAATILAGRRLPAGRCGIWSNGARINGVGALRFVARPARKLGFLNEAKLSRQRWTCVCAALLMLVALGVTPNFQSAASGQTMINTQPRFGSVNDSFYEYSGVNWGVNFGNTGPGRGGSRSAGSFSFGAPAFPPFGGYNPGSGANFGFARSGNPNYNFGFTLAKGNNRSISSTALTTTSLNGYPSNFFSGINRNFVTGFVPVVGGGFGNGFYGYPPVGYGVYLNQTNYRHPAPGQRYPANLGAYRFGRPYQRFPGQAHYNQFGRHNYVVHPLYPYNFYSPCCSVCGCTFCNCGFNNFGLGNFGLGNFGLGNWGQGNWGGGFGYGLTYLQQLSIGAFDNSYSPNVFGYSDGYGNIASTPMSGTIAASILQSRADAVALAQHVADSDASPEFYAGPTDPLGNPTHDFSENLAASQAPKSRRHSTATQAVKSVSEIRAQVAEEIRIETQLRQAAVERLIDQARALYKNGEVEKAIEISRQALDKCTENDAALKQKIQRGISVMQDQ